MTFNARTLCISHGEDADGLICAAYLARLKGASVALTSYDDVKDVLSSVAPPVEELFICDLNVRKELSCEILRIGKFAKITVVDHHPTARDVLDEIEGAGVTVVYSAAECASALMYDHFRGDLGGEGARLAAYAAVSDMFEDGPIASDILRRFDRQFVQHEALILTHALSHDNSTEFRTLVVRELSNFARPHQMKGAVEAAVAQLDQMSRLIETIPSKAVRLGRLAYVEAGEVSSIGAVANLVIDSMDVDVGVSYKSIGRGTLNVSVRAKRGLKVHLGNVTRRLAEKHGGFGGGHDRASGASIPHSSLDGLIKDLAIELEAD